MSSRSLMDWGLIVNFLYYKNMSVEKLRSLEEYARLMAEYKGNPYLQSVLKVEISAAYSYYTGLLEPIEAVKPMKWIAIKESGDEKDISDKKTEMLWRSTEEGRKEYEYKMKLKAFDKMLSAINSNLFMLRKEQELQ